MHPYPALNAFDLVERLVSGIHFWHTSFYLTSHMSKEICLWGGGGGDKNVVYGGLEF